MRFRYKFVHPILGTRYNHSPLPENITITDIIKSGGIQYSVPLHPSYQWVERIMKTCPKCESGMEFNFGVKYHPQHLEVEIICPNDKCPYRKKAYIYVGDIMGKTEDDE